MADGLKTYLLLLEEMHRFDFATIKNDEWNSHMITTNNLIVGPDGNAYAIHFANNSDEDDGYFIPLPSKVVGNKLIRIWKTIRDEVLEAIKFC